MKFNLPDAALAAADADKLRVGNVYPARGGKGTAFWVVVAITESGASCLGLDREGNISSTVSYSRYVFEGGQYTKGRPCIGFVEGLEGMQLDVQWGCA